MITIDTKALRALEAEASAGPWKPGDYDGAIDSPEGRVFDRCSGLIRQLDADEAFVCALRNAAPALLDAAEENEKLRDEAQRWVDRAAYYRNLAIEAGVKREALDNEDDARLVDLWESNQAERVALKAEVERLRELLDLASYSVPNWTPLAGRISAALRGEEASRGE